MLSHPTHHMPWLRPEDVKSVIDQQTGEDRRVLGLSDDADSKVLLVDAPRAPELVQFSSAKVAQADGLWWVLAMQEAVRHARLLGRTVPERLIVITDWHSHARASRELGYYVRAAAPHPTPESAIQAAKNLVRSGFTLVEQDALPTQSVRFLVCRNT